jgi:ionotropic glutamate receptor
MRLFRYRIMELAQSGLMDYWDLKFHPSSPCTANTKSGYKKAETSKISLKNLTGAFVVLLIGFSLSLLAFLCELIFSVPQRQMFKTKKVVNLVMESPTNAEEPTIN